MYRSVCSLLLLLLSSAVSTTLCAQTASQQQKQPKQSKTNDATLKGCVDEQDGQYMLINDRTRDPIVKLVAEGFPREGFAKHLGRTVTVRGTSSTVEGSPVFRVRSIEVVSEVCGPQQH